MFPYLPIAPEPLRLQPACIVACPICGGTLVELRGQQRCSRCYFIICENCEGAGADAGDYGGGPAGYFSP